MAEFQDIAKRLAALAALAAEWNSAPVLKLYRTLSLRDLRDLRHAFLLDRESGADIAFCDRRVAVIDQVLTERGKAFGDHLDRLRR